MKKLYLFLLVLSGDLAAQNVGVGTATPQAKLEVNGDLKLQNGSSVNKFSRDSSFVANSHNNVPTEKAVKDYLQKGFWIPEDLNAPGPNAPLFRNSAFSGLSGPVSVVVRGSYAYVASIFSNSLITYDISNPDNMVFQSAMYTNLDDAYSLALQNNYAYVASKNNNRLCIFDVSNPAAMVAKGFTSTGLDQPYSVAVQGNYAYVASYGNNLFRVYDISNPDALTPAGFAGVVGPMSVYVQGNYAYVSGQSQLSIFNISNPNAITLAGFTSTNLSGACRSVVVAGNYAYVVSSGNNSFSIFDISNPTNIIPKGTTASNLQSPWSVFVQGSHAYVTSETNSLFCIYDVSNPNLIVPKGSSSQNLNYPAGVYVLGGFAYVTNYYGDRLCIFDLDKNRTLLMGPEGISTTTFQWQNSGSNINRATGNVGIGILYPTEKLSINGNIKTNGHLDFGNTAGNKINLWGTITGEHYGLAIAPYQFQIHTDNSLSDISFGHGAQLSFIETMRIKGDGNAILAGTLTQNSDAKLKKNIRLLNGSLEKIVRLNGYNYQWIHPANDQSLQTGLIAQEVQQFFPELVKENNGVLSVNYSGLIPVMIESIKEQQKQIDELKSQVRRLLKR